jgi:isoquinoline 1-oxidoreductase alpha subunit
MKLTVNGKAHEVKASPDTPLLWVLRDECGLTGTKYGCGAGLCGVCTVHLDGAAVRSCMLPVAAAEGAEVTTIEGLAPDPRLHPLQQAWLDEDVSQCGYCQPGMLMAAAALLKENPRPSAEELAAGLQVLCRCGTYPRVLRAIRSRVSP